MYIIFKNETKYTDKTYDDYCSFHTKSHWISYVLYTLIVIVIIGTCLFYQIKTNNYILIAIAAIALIGFIGWRYLYPKYTREKTLGSDIIKNQITYTFTFYDNSFEVSSKEDPQSITVFKYNQLYKVYNTGAYFYLYTDKTHSYILKSNCFTIGDKKDFSSFIKKKCLFKYKMSKK